MDSSQNQNNTGDHNYKPPVSPDTQSKEQVLEPQLPVAPEGADQAQQAAKVNARIAELEAEITTKDARIAELEVAVEQHAEALKNAAEQIGDLELYTRVLKKTVQY